MNILYGQRCDFLRDPEYISILIHGKTESQSDNNKQQLFYPGWQ